MEEFKEGDVFVFYYKDEVVIIQLQSLFYSFLLSGNAHRYLILDSETDFFTIGESIMLSYCSVEYDIKNGGISKISDTFNIATSILDSYDENLRVELWNRFINSFPNLIKQDNMFPEHIAEDMSKKCNCNIMLLMQKGCSCGGA